MKQNWDKRIVELGLIITEPLPPRSTYHAVVFDGLLAYTSKKKLCIKNDSILTRCPITQGQWIHIITSKINIVID